MAPSNLTLIDHEGHTQGQPNFKASYLAKEPS